MLMIRGQDKWLNSNVCDVCFLSQAPQGSRQRRQPSVTRACDGRTERTQGQQQGSHRADDVKDCREPRFCGNGHRQHFWTDLPLCRAGCERSCGLRTETNTYLLSYNLNLRRTGQGCSDAARDSRTRPVLQN